MNNKEQELEYATEILNQMKAFGQVAMWSWGFRQPTMLPSGQMSGDRYRRGGLQFRVSGRVFKGLVRVNLMADDTYTLQFGRIVKNGFLCTKEMPGHYFDEFMETLDLNIESGVAA